MEQEPKISSVNTEAQTWVDEYSDGNWNIEQFKKPDPPMSTI